MAASYQTVLQRIGYYQLCIALATILNDEPLLDDQGMPTLPSPRQELSCDGLCYLKVVGVCCQGELYLAHVASSPEALRASDVQLVFLTEEQLHLALPWDIRVIDVPPENTQSRIEAHAATLRPACPNPLFGDPLLHWVADALELPEEQPLPVLHDACISAQELTSVVASIEQRHLPLQQALLTLFLEILTPAIRRLSQQAYEAFHQAHALLQWVRRCAPHKKVVTLSYEGDLYLQARFWHLKVVQPQW